MTSVSAEHYSYARREKVRSKTLFKSAAYEEVLFNLDVGVTVSFECVHDVEKFVGEIDRNNNFCINDRGNKIKITVYRTKNICSVDECGSTANQKFDGNWLCDSHLNSYTERYI